MVVDCGLTVCVKAIDVLVLKFVSPLYLAVIECEPAVSAEVDNCAVPPLSATTPSEVAPSRNCTVPVAFDGETVAVNMTLWPYVDGFRLDDTLVVVECGLTVCVSGADVLVLKFASPLYLAVIECDPAVSADVDSCALPPLTATTPSDVAPSRNCTVPVAVADETVAVNVTL